MTNVSTRILGLDPGLRRTGWGVIESEGSRLRWIAHGVVAPDDKAPFSERLLHLLEEVGSICAAYSCDEAAIEEVFVNMNGASTLKLGHARAAVMLAPVANNPHGGPHVERARALLDQIKTSGVGETASD